MKTENGKRIEKPEPIKLPVTRSQGKNPESYKQAHDAYLRARSLLMYLYNRKILPAEDAMLYYAFHVKYQESNPRGFGPVWDEVAEAGKMATAGYGVKLGEIRLKAKPLDGT